MWFTISIKQEFGDTTYNTILLNTLLRFKLCKFPKFESLLLQNTHGAAVQNFG